MQYCKSKNVLSFIIIIIIVWIIIISVKYYILLLIRISINLSGTTNPM